MYNTWVTDSDDVKARIIAAVESIDVDMLQCTWQQLDYHLDVLYITNGAHVKCLDLRYSKKKKVWVLCV